MRVITPVVSTGALPGSTKNLTLASKVRQRPVGSVETFSGKGQPAAATAGAQNSELATPEGHARIAVKTTALGGGIYRYDYVVMNLDFARAVIS